MSTLKTGSHVGAYEILALIGAGGQGEVYRARDTRLDRSVAIKVLSSSAAAHSDLGERFEREAQTVASLNHPHICALYDIGRDQNVDFLVMEYLEGQTLTERLAKGPLPLDQALRVATEIADALDKAHRKEITHRDLKPSNIMLTKAGAKLLDFGLAKRGPQWGPGGSMSQLPTDANLTAHGMILGTLQYMPPEQLEGMEADARSDIFAFGAVLYEMITGKKAFEGKSQVSLMAAILEHEPPPVSSLQPLTPPLLDRLIRKCLAKDPNERWQSAADLFEGLQWIKESKVAVSAAPIRTARWKAAAILGVALVAVGVASAALLTRRPANEAPVWVSVIPPDGNFAASPALAVSPDGKHIVFGGVNASGVNSLWVNSLDSPTVRELPSTSSFQFTPFWSPDSRSIGFFAGGRLQRVNVDGGNPQVLAQAPNARGGSWGSDGTIIFTPSAEAGIFKISASGGTATPVRAPDAAYHDINCNWPHFLPDGNHYLYYLVNPDPQRQGLYVASLESTDPKRILDTGSRAEYAGGYLFYGQGADLFAQPFDITRLELNGQPERTAGGVGWSAGDARNRAFSASAGGTLAFSRQFNGAARQLTWFDRSGRQLENLGDPGEYFGFAVAPNQKSVVLEKISRQTGSSESWLLDLPAGIPVKLPGNWTITPIWSPDSERILYKSPLSPAVAEIVSVDSRKTEPFPGLSSFSFLHSWSNDGRFVVGKNQADGIQSDLWVFHAGGDTKAAPFLETPFNEDNARVSPNGRWVAYDSNESGQAQVYVESFPVPGKKKGISTKGGQFPEWRADGRELYYLEPSGQRRNLMAVRVDPTVSILESSPPELLFATPEMSTTGSRSQFAAFGAGDRFLLNVLTEETKPRSITIVLNWPALLK